MHIENKIAIKKVKKTGQIFTPPFIVQSMLSYCNYSGEHILGKHIIDNSCGEGAFLQPIVRQYIETAQKQHLSTAVIKQHIETYIHGIDIDSIAIDRCKQHLSAIAQQYGIEHVNWDLYNANSLLFNKFNNKMHYVVGNPPYVRVHNLDETYKSVKSYHFANGGMTDLYLAFFELGFNMLAENAQLCYITPISWLNSLAAENMRRYILNNKNLLALINLQHFQAFNNATAYTLIAHFKKSNNGEYFDYYTYNATTHKRDFVEKLCLKDVYIDSCFYLGKRTLLNMMHEIKTTPQKKYVSVKNGFATLADAIFIGNDIPQSAITIPVIKASTGKWYKCLFPYDTKGKPLSIEKVFANKHVKTYLLQHKQYLLKGRPECDSWYLFGRTQALADVYKQKLSVNTLIRNKDDFKLSTLQPGEGVYSGLYVTTNFDIPFDVIKQIIASDECAEYIKMLKKYKSGGYYTFNSKDLEQFINYTLTYKSNTKYAIKSTILDNNTDLFQGIY